MKLYCVRHGEAQPADVDPQCGLTEVGKADVASVAQQLSAHKIYIPHIMHSPKLRAQQTANIFSECLNVSQVNECSEILDAEADIMPMLEMIKAFDQDTMLVGHLPFMAKLVSALVIGDENNYPIVNFPPGAVVCLDFYENNRWIINWLLRPNIVRALRK